MHQHKQEISCYKTYRALNMVLHTFHQGKLQRIPHPEPSYQVFLIIHKSKHLFINYTQVKHSNEKYNQTSPR